LLDGLSASKLNGKHKYGTFSFTERPKGRHCPWK